MEMTAPCLPNPDSRTDPDWESFSDYLKRNNIYEVEHPALKAYQNAQEGRYLNSGALNHCLNLLHFGSDSAYAVLAEEPYGTEISDWEPEPSRSAIDSLFVQFSYRFDSRSIVYKGIGLEPFYEILDIRNLKPGKKIFFPGFLSTSVSREKAESFSSTNKLLLAIRGLDQVNAIIPPNQKVINTMAPHIPEQEILLDRATTFKVVANCLQTDGWQVVELSASVSSCDL